MMLPGEYMAKHRNPQWDPALSIQRSPAKVSHVCWADVTDGRQVSVVSKLALGTLDIHAGLAVMTQETCVFWSV